MRRPADSPTVAVLAIVTLVYLCEVTLSLVIGRPEAFSMFALAPPLTERPWTIVTSVYGHWGIEHLLTNAIGLLIAGALVERHTSARTFHAYVLLTGVLAALSELLVAVSLGPHVPGITTNVAVMGISGSVMALIGYLLASNALTAMVVGRVAVSPRAQILIVLAVAAGVTYLTTGPQVAVVAHFTGLLVGLVAGHRRLLSP